MAEGDRLIYEFRCPQGLDMGGLGYILYWIVHIIDETEDANITYIRMLDGDLIAQTEDIEDNLAYYDLESDFDFEIQIPDGISLNNLGEFIQRFVKAIENTPFDDDRIYHVTCIDVAPGFADLEPDSAEATAHFQNGSFSGTMEATP